jgi:hypothetical protein
MAKATHALYVIPTINVARYIVAPNEAVEKPPDAMPGVNMGGTLTIPEEE